MPALIVKILDWINQNFGAISSQLRIRNAILRKLFQLAFFVVTLHLFYSYIGIYRYIFERPCSIHSSAQCQRASVALNYYQVDMNFFEPRIQRFNNSDDITGLEFPVIYYTAALLYKMFGFHDFYLRIISLILVSAGLIAFFLLVKSILKNAVLATLVTSSVILSPVLMFYSANFMPDAPSLAFTIMSWFFFFRFTSVNKQRDLNLFCFFGTLAGLIKAVSLMCFGVIICILLLDRIKKFRDAEGNPVFKKRLPVLMRIFTGIGIVFLWYYYARWLSIRHGNQSFAMVPIMIDDLNGFHYVMTYLQNWTYQYYAKETYVLLVCSVIFVLVAFRRVNKLLLAITVLYFLACVCYVYLFFYQFAHHDYYFVALMPLAFFVVLMFADGLTRLTLKYSRVVMFFFSVIMFFNIKECLFNCRENYTFRFEGREYLGGDYRPYYDLEPKMRALGITRKDKVVSAFDNSYSNSLYFMNQPGFTVEDVYEKDTIVHALNAPFVKYLVVNDSAKFNKIYKADLSDRIIITHRGLIVYKMK